MMKQQDEKIFKICVFGNPGVGKSSLIRNFIHGKSSQFNNLMKGLDMTSTIINIDDFLLRLSFYEIDERERLSTTRNLFYHNCQGVIIVFDSCQPETFANLTTWLDELESLATPFFLNVPFLFLANKIDLCDLESFSLEDTFETIKNICSSYGINVSSLKFHEVSAFGKENIVECFNEFGQMLVNRFIKAIPG